MRREYPSVSCAHTERNVIADRTKERKAFYCCGVQMTPCLGWQLNAYEFYRNDCFFLFVWTLRRHHPLNGDPKHYEEIPLTRYVRSNTAVRYRP